MIKWFKRFLHDKLGWHVPSQTGWFDGCNVHSTCARCGKEIMRDGQGNWF